MTARDVCLFVAVGILGALAISAYGSPRWREQPCEARWQACSAQLERSGARVGELTRQIRKYCRHD